MGDGRKGTPDFLVERLARNELPAAEAELLRARLEAEGGPDRLEELRRSDEELLRAHPPGPAVAEIRRRAQAGKPSPPPFRIPVLAFALPLAVAAALIVVAVLPQQQPFPGEPEEITRVKGLAPHLAVYRKSGADAERLGAGALARAGDLLQVGYVAAGRPFGAVLSVDGRGAVTLHWPEQEEAIPRLAQDGEVTLPQAYELDDAPAYERFFLVTSPEPFEVAEVMAAARALAEDPATARTAALQLLPGLEQVSIELEKAGP